MSFTVYILRLRDGSYYTGHTNDLQRRLAEHRLGSGSRYVRGRLPFMLVYFEKVESKGEAMKREKQIKRMSRKRKERLIGWLQE